MLVAAVTPCGERPACEDDGVTQMVKLPDGYSELVAAVRADVVATGLRAARAADHEMLGLYWRVGRLVLERQDRQGWGTK